MSGFLTRRQFGRRLPLPSLLLALGSRRAFASSRRAVPPRLDQSGVGLPRERALGSVLPIGELAERIRLTAERLARHAPPFEDLEACGRYLGAFSLLPPGGADSAPFARELLKRQQADGRFGDPALRISADADGSRLQAFLRANGRVLVGLLEHLESSGDSSVLGAAVRLGAFAQGVVEAATDARIAAHLATIDAKASLTQLAEGLVLLAEASDERRFLDTARALRPFVQGHPGGGAADHLASLRGLLSLATSTADAPLLRDLEALYRDLVQSTEVTAMRELPEVLGRPGPPHLAAGAELVRVSLQVWDRTRAADALEHAERGLWNHLFAEQRPDGDFRAAALAPEDRGTGSGAEQAPGGEGAGLASCHRAFRDVLDHLARHEEETTFAELLLDADVTEPGFTLTLRHEMEGPATSRLVLEVEDAAPGPQGLALRKPAWATVSLLLFGGGRILLRAGPYVNLHRRWRAGETIEMVLEHAARVETRDHRSLDLATLAVPTEGALVVGPWVMAADEAQSPEFFAGPGPVARTILLPPSLPASGTGEGGPPFTDRARHLRLRFRTEGGAETGLVTLAPISEATGRAPGRRAAWLRYLRAD